MALWERARLPRGFDEVWRQELGSLAELAPLRARLRTSMTGSPTVLLPEQEHWSERVVQIADELTSNALRHGTAPVATHLGHAGDEWLISVSDSSPDQPPSPAEGRNPELGGFGLYLVADLAVRHGWWPGDDDKTAWAVVAGGPRPA